MPKAKHHKIVKRHAATKVKRPRKSIAAKTKLSRPEVKLHMPPPGAGGEERNDWFYRRRAWPNDEINPESYPHALAQARQIPALRSAGKHGSLATFTWQNIGPFSIDGRVSSIATHPTDSNTFYVGAAAGGLWKTTDHGASWKCVTDTFGTLSIGCVTIDPTDPEVLYLGQGECNNSADSYPGNGLWKSTNGGSTWTYLGFAKSLYISKVIVDPRDHNTLFLSSPGPGASSDTNRGVYKSTDAGQTWKRSLLPRLTKSATSRSVGVIDIAMNPVNSAQLIAYAWDHSLVGATGFSSGPSGPGTGMWRSIDSGKSWKRIDTIASSGLPNGYKQKILARGALLWLNDNGSSYLYAAITRADSNAVTHYRFDENFKGLYRSTDDGVTWTKTIDSTFRIPMGGVQGKDSADIMNQQGGYNLYLAGNPLHPAEVYLGGIDVLRSNDHGSTFTNITKSYSEYYVKGNRDQHSDQHGLAFTASKTGADMIVVSDGGLFHTLDFGNSWSQMKGLPITMFYGIEPWRGGMKNTPSTITASDLKLFGGTQDNGTVGHGLTPDPDYSWINAGDGGIAQSHPTDPEKLVTSLQLGVIFVRNSLDSLRAQPLDAKDTSHNTKPRWHAITNRLLRGPTRLTDTTEPCAFIAPVVLDDRNPSDLYTARLHVYHAKIDYADPENTKWYRWSPPIAGDTAHTSGWYYGDVETMAVGPHDANGHPMLWAGGSIFLANRSAVWRTRVDLNRQDTVAPSWVLVNKGLPGTTISSITPDRSDSMTAFITTMGSEDTDRQHVLKTTDGGASWQNISNNLPHTPVSALVIDTLNENGDPSLKNQLLIVATDVGVFASTNGGDYWNSLSEGMPNIIVSDLRIYKNMLIAATHGRSLYAMDISQLRAGALSVDDRSVSESQPLAIYPNPARSGSTVNFQVEDAGKDLECILTNESNGHQLRAEVVESATGAAIEIAPETIPGAYIVQVLGEGKILAQGRISIVK